MGNGKLIDLLDRNLADDPAVDVDVEGLYDVRVFVIPDHEYDPVLLGLWQPELFVDGLFAENILIHCRPVLVLDDDLELAVRGIGVGDVEDEHVVLRAEVFYRCGVVRSAGGLGLCG